MPSVSTSSASVLDFAPDPPNQYLNHWVQQAQGTIDDFYRINVDTSIHIPMKKVKGYAHNVVHICIDSAPGDHQLWEMTVPPGVLHQLLIHGRNEDKFHLKKKCSVTYGICVKVAEDNRKSLNHMFSYWLVQFSPEITLQNGVFSDDQIEVLRNKVSLSHYETETGIIGIASNCMMVYWEIAEKKAGLHVETKQDSRKGGRR
jgi:hypothetical protein